MIDIIISMFLSSLMSVFIPLWVVQTNNNIKNNNNDYVMMYFMKLRRYHTMKTLIYCTLKYKSAVAGHTP